MTARGRDWGPLWLVAGAVCGLVLAATGIGGVDGDPEGSATGGVPEGGVAVVGGRVITVTDYQRALSAVAADRRGGALDVATRRRTLDRLIDEELLIQRGVEMELAHRDRGVRNMVTAAVITMVVASAEEAVGDPTEAQLRAFFDGNRYLFGHPGRVWVRQRFFALGGDATDALRRATAASARLRAGAALSEVVGDADPMALPDSLLPPQTLREYLGPTATERVLTLDAGETTPPVRSSMGYHVIRVVERRPGAVKPFAQVRELVRRELVRHAGDRGLRRFLDERRALVAVTVADERL